MEGKTCYNIAEETEGFFLDLGNVAHVARGVLRGLSLLERVGVVHCDLKPDNVILIQIPSDDGGVIPHVRIVDFGCAHLDQRCNPEQNWNLAESGAGHIAYASPEMNLRLPVTHKSDVWSFGVLLCELHSGRGIWFSEGLTPEEIMAQGIGLAGLEDGVPSSLVRCCPLEIQRFYTPMFTFCRGHLPVSRTVDGFVEVLRPKQLGLEQVLGDDWLEAGKSDLRTLLQAALQFDHQNRPTAEHLLRDYAFVNSSGLCRTWSSQVDSGSTAQYDKKGVPPKRKPSGEEVEPKTKSNWRQRMGLQLPRFLQGRRVPATKGKDNRDNESHVEASATKAVTQPA